MSPGWLLRICLISGLERAPLPETHVALPTCRGKSSWLKYVSLQLRMRPSQGLGNSLSLSLPSTDHSQPHARPPHSSFSVSLPSSLTPLPGTCLTQLSTASWAQVSTPGMGGAPHGSTEHKGQPALAKCTHGVTVLGLRAGWRAHAWQAPQLHGSEPRPQGTWPPRLSSRGPEPTQKDKGKGRKCQRGTRAAQHRI